jgi:hypothetical protein
MIQINMDLPKSCEECPCCQPDAHHWFYSCGVTGEDVMDSEYKHVLEHRPQWCPIKEVNK